MVLFSKLLTFLVFLFLLLLTSFPLVSSIDESTAASDLANAEEALASAYHAVLDAEEAGANVTDLLDSLNVGGEYLAEAHVWYRLGAYENATVSAGFCREAVSDVSGGAMFLRAEAERLGETNFAATLYSSIIGVVGVLIGGFVVWLFFKRRYNKRVLELKPEMVLSES